MNSALTHVAMIVNPIVVLNDRILCQSGHQHQMSWPLSEKSSSCYFHKCSGLMLDLWMMDAVENAEEKSLQMMECL